MDRREFVIASGIAATTSLLGQTANAQGESHAHHDHGNPKARAVSPALKELRDSTFECLKTGEICLAQCTAVLAGGKTSMAECQATVLNMLAAVTGMAKVAAYNDSDVKLMKAMAKVCGDFCRACEKECKPHSEDHAECKACMEACVRCAKACDKFVKA